MHRTWHPLREWRWFKPIYNSSKEGQEAIGEFLKTSRGKQTAKEILPQVVGNADLPDDGKKRSGKSWKEYE